MRVREIKCVLAFLFFVSFFSCDKKEDAVPVNRMQLNELLVGTYELNLNDPTMNSQAPVDQPIIGTFSDAIDISNIDQNIQLKLNGSGEGVPLAFTFLNDNKTFSASPDQELAPGNSYQLVISEKLKGTNNSSFAGFIAEFSTAQPNLELLNVMISGMEAFNSARIQNVPLTGTDVQVTFSRPIDPSKISASSFRIITTNGNSVVPSTATMSEANKKVTLTINQTLKDFTRYRLSIPSGVLGVVGESFAGYSKDFYTGQNAANDFPIISDEELLTKVQQQTFKYFWDFAHPASGMARERNSSGSTITTGGSGFGIMSLIVGMERNFITRQQGIERMDKILDFLESADRFHGVWPHWLNGDTGKVIPFSAKDNGGDLVETSFLVQGLITFRQYLNAGDATELSLINRINTLWQEVEWDWHRKNNENVLYWHWSPNYNWEMNFAMYGYFEEQITYFLAASSPTHSIPKEVYSNGYGRNGSIVKNNIYYNIKLPLESPAPLFWVHYSYLGLDPHFTDDYANYWEQNVNATLINQAYCIANPKKFVGYSEECWGLTSSDNQSGYNAHSPSNDLGVITPTAALSSFPYTPEESMKALKFFYYKVGDRLWGEYGFYDAFNLTEGWTANSYLAIDQGPIIVMIENHRSGLLWDLFMSAPEVQDGLDKLDFTY